LSALAEIVARPSPGFSCTRSFGERVLAQALIREVLAWLEGTITLNVATTNVAAQNLYKRIGFTVEGEFMRQFNGHACPVAKLRYDKMA
jgi:ribosomal protein S18 acetylase RimI-like enzyme